MICEHDLKKEKMFWKKNKIINNNRDGVRYVLLRVSCLRFVVKKKKWTKQTQQTETMQIKPNKTTCNVKKTNS